MIHETIRLLGKSGQWVAFDCTIKPGDPGNILVPKLDGEWLIHSTGMVANIGGNDWRIYDLHPEDCARIYNRSLEAGQ